MRVLKIRTEEYENAEKVPVKGLSIELSPYDRPRGIEGRFDGDLLHIDFKYLDQEVSVSKPLNDKVNMKVGKYSGKILGFEVAMRKFEIKEAVIKIAQAVDQLIPKLAKYNERANYQVIKTALHENRDRFSELSSHY